MSHVSPIGDWRHLFQRAIAAAPERLHFAAHSHHLWPDASYLGHQAAWDDAARLADRKWDRVMGTIWPAAQAHVAQELNLPDPSSIVFAGNTHDFLIRLVSAIDARPARILVSDGEFHTVRRQTARWAETGDIRLERVASGPGLADRLIERAATFEPHLIIVSQVLFGTGRITGGLERLAALARPEGPWLLVDGYHGFMSVPTDFGPLADKAFYVAGGYKYAMAGEGCAFLHAPPGYAERPAITGWYAEFADLATPASSGVGYARDAMRLMGATFDPSGLYRFVAVRDRLAAEALDTARIAAHCAGLRDRLLAGIGSAPLGNAQLLNPPSAGDNARFLAFRSRKAAEWQATLASDDIVTDVRGDVLRIGFGLYQSARDVDHLLDALQHLPG